ncbi:hypothetical protein M885DRAFT_557068 [Pelagophyceae sp. CCMP2097]|nr:hypothetical protein M885DRAFT_557068 [Pelagophyceae sp. CCMP2097]
MFPPPRPPSMNRDWRAGACAAGLRRAVVAEGTSAAASTAERIRASRLVGASARTDGMACSTWLVRDDADEYTCHAVSCGTVTAWADVATHCDCPLSSGDGKWCQHVAACLETLVDARAADADAAAADADDADADDADAAEAAATVRRYARAARLRELLRPLPRRRARPVEAGVDVERIVNKLSAVLRLVRGRWTVGDYKEYRGDRTKQHLARLIAMKWPAVTFSQSRCRTTHAAPDGAQFTVDQILAALLEHLDHEREERGYLETDHIFFQGLTRREDGSFTPKWGTCAQLEFERPPTRSGAARIRVHP